MRKIIIAGNWKMNKNLAETEDFARSLAEFASGHNVPGVRMIIAPAFPFIRTAQMILEAQPVAISAQDVSLHRDGAFTGEVSGTMLSSLGCEFCIIGHSERRQYHAEKDLDVRDKQLLLRSLGITPIICIGETLEQRDSGITDQVLIDQLTGCFRDVSLNTGEEVIVAYEPVWAIGTGRTATPQQAEEAHALIRSWFRTNYHEAIAERMHILYGGSVKPENIADLLAQPDIDGGLIGGASLDPTQFANMTATAVSIYTQRTLS